MDWSPLSETPCYKTSSGNTWHVGQCVAVLAINLISLGVNPTLLHLVGFSLGAHTAGFVGKKLQNILKIAPGRITGLDPSLPLYMMSEKRKKLDKSDATFVDVIHTSAGSFGKIEAVGHVDFYVNGGALQPACYNASRTKFKVITWVNQIRPSPPKFSSFLLFKTLSFWTTILQLYRVFFLKTKHSMFLNKRKF